MNRARAGQQRIRKPRTVCVFCCKRPGLLYFANPRRGARAWKSTAITILFAGRSTGRAGHFLGYVSRSQAALNKLCANWNWIESGQLYRAIAAPRVTTHDRLSRESRAGTPRDSLSALHVMLAPRLGYERRESEWSLDPAKNGEYFQRLSRPRDRQVFARRRLKARPGFRRLETRLAE